MSVSRTSPEERKLKAELARIRKKVTGGTFTTPKCSVCGKDLTDRELLMEDFIWSVGKAGSVQFHPACFRKEFGKKEVQE